MLHMHSMPLVFLFYVPPPPPPHPHTYTHPSLLPVVQLGEKLWGAQWSGHCPQHPQVVLCGHLSREGRHLEKNSTPMRAQPQSVHEQHRKSVELSRACVHVKKYEATCFNITFIAKGRCALGLSMHGVMIVVLLSVYIDEL